MLADIHARRDPCSQRPIGDLIEITAADGHRLSVYCVPPKGRSRGGLIVNQELFGVNAHIKSVAERFAAEGYFALAPAYYDRVERGFAVGYGLAELELARAALPKLNLDKMLLDGAAALRFAAAAGKVGMVGYCSGGSTAWAAAGQLEGLACAISYYGGRIPAMSHLKPRVPVMLHWGETDHTISMEAVQEVTTEHPEVVSHVYAAGHGFNCDLRTAYEPVSAETAYARSVEFLRSHVG